MSLYLVRVELHSANETQYSTLHDRMSQHGFYRYILGDDGVIYSLPSAMYVKASTDNIITVRIDASTIAGQVCPWISPNPEVLVVEYSVAAWSGLPMAPV